MANTLFFMMREPGQPDQVLVWDTRTLSVGRAPENDLVVEDDEVSRKHAVLENEGGAMQVGDYRTGNGTFVNGERVGGKAKIQPGSVIAIGKLQLELGVSAEHPAKLGHKLVYASQLKMAGVLPDGMDGDCTMLGMADTQQTDEPFVIEPERSSGSQAFVVGPDDEAGFQVRQLDSELGNSLDLDEGMGLHDPIELPAVDPMQADPVTGESSVQAAPSENELDPIERMKKLKTLHEAGLITDEEFAAKRAQILSEV